MVSCFLNVDLRRVQGRLTNGQEYRSLCGVHLTWLHKHRLTAYRSPAHEQLDPFCSNMKHFSAALGLNELGQSRDDFADFSTQYLRRLRPLNTIHKAA